MFVFNYEFNDFFSRFFTRNLKPVQEHKIKGCKEFVPLVSFNRIYFYERFQGMKIINIPGELYPVH